MSQGDYGEKKYLVDPGSTGTRQGSLDKETSIEAALESDRPGPGNGWNRLERSNSFRFLVALVIVGLYGFFIFRLIKNQF